MSQPVALVTRKQPTVDVPKVNRHSYWPLDVNTFDFTFDFRIILSCWLTLFQTVTTTNMVSSARRAALVLQMRIRRVTSQTEVARVIPAGKAVTAI